MFLPTARLPMFDAPFLSLSSSSPQPWHSTCPCTSRLVFCDPIANTSATYRTPSPGCTPPVKVGVVCEDVRHLRVRYLVDLVVHVPPFVVVEAHPSHITEHDDGVALTGAGDEFVRHLIQLVFDRSGFLVTEALDDLRSRADLCLPD